MIFRNSLQHSATRQTYNNMYLYSYYFGIGNSENVFCKHVEISLMRFQFLTLFIRINYIFTIKLTLN